MRKNRRVESLHDEILARMTKIHDSLKGAITISPTTLAAKTHEHFINNKEVEFHIQYASIQHLKQMARGILSHAHDPRTRLKDLADTTHEMFADLLQDRYPIPHAGLKDPEYKLRQYCSDGELDFNIIKLRKTGGAFLQHADALEAYKQSRRGDSADAA